jgi:hypothetical protein
MCRMNFLSHLRLVPLLYAAWVGFTSNLIQPLLWPSVTLATLSADDVVMPDAATSQMRTSGSAPLAQRGSRRDPLTIQIHTYMLDGAVLFTSFETEWGGVREDGN